MTSSKRNAVKNNYLAITLILIFSSLNLLLSLQMAEWSHDWLPKQASTAAPYVDNLFALETGIGTFIFLGCIGVMSWVLIFNRADKYDETDGAPIEGNILLEIIWTIIPLVIVIAIATYSTKINYTLQNLGEKQKYNTNSPPPEFALTKEDSFTGPIKIISRQWNWEFIYPEGVHSSELHLPIDKRANLLLISEDVLHSFYVPAFRLKQDIIPGSIISYNLTPTRLGTFRLRDAMFSGAYFSENQTNVIVESEESFKKWIKNTSSKDLQEGLSVANTLYQKRLKSGNKGWATVPPAPPPLVNDPGDPLKPHDS